MDEMAHQEWADAPEKACFVPIYHAGDRVDYPVPRTGKRITLLACVTADGSFLKPAIVSPRKISDEDVMFFAMSGRGIPSFQSLRSGEKPFLTPARPF
jgi:hypothetical protein